MQPHILKARAPAKLIISGEHAVLYEQPALAVAINKYTTTCTSWRDGGRIHFKLPELSYAKSLTLKALRRLKNDLHSEYQNFLQGKCKIRGVIKKPFELLQYSVSNFLEQFNLQMPRGVEISVDSDIPIGCGMGSSAAVVLSSLYALCNFLQLGWAREQILNVAKQIESLQHGKSSGLDLHLVSTGGGALFSQDKVQTRKITSFPISIVNTGKPASTTGECVEKVRYFMNEQLAREFGEVTLEIDRAIAVNDTALLQAAIQQNHDLLRYIQVVPAKVASFINEIERANGAAKICGAGGVYGDSAGAVLVIGGDDVAEIANWHGYQIEQVEVDNYGTQVL